MKKTRFALLCMAPLTVFAIEADWEHDISVSSGKTSVTYDQNGQEITVGHGGLSLYHSNTTDVGISWGTPLLMGLSGSLSYDRMADDDNVVGIGTSINQWGLSINPSLDWNINDSEWDSTVEVGYGLMGLDAAYSVDFSIDETELTGSEFSLGYAWNVGDGLTVTPNVTVPFDSDWERDTAVVGLSISIALGSGASE